MADGFAILSDEHVKARELFERCLSTQDEAALRELCDALTVHAQLEEQVLYPELRRLVDGGDDYADDAEQEHAAVKVLVERVEIVAPPDLGEVVAEMQRLVEAHAAHEEGTLFPEMRQSGVDADTLASRLEEARQGIEARSRG